MSRTYLWGGDQRKTDKLRDFRGGPSLYFRGLPPQNYLTLPLPLPLPLTLTLPPPTPSVFPTFHLKYSK
jgi:hypothetical protein